MKKQLIITSSTKDLFMVYDDEHCFYVVSVGNIEVNENGVTSENVLYSSEHIQDCINYFENGGVKWKQNTTVWKRF